jgi:hypothetical protein
MSALEAPIQKNAAPSQEGHEQEGYESQGYEGKGGLSFAADGEDAAQLKRIQTAANDSPQVQQLRAIQRAVSQSFQVQHSAQLRAAAAQYAGPAQPLQRVAANNTGLPDQLKSGIESLSGMAMDDVKVHYNSSKPADVGAHAYAQGSDIHVAPGQEQHLPHEAWHVVQQKQGRVAATRQLKGIGINDDAGLEHEADVMGGKAMQMKSDGAVAPSLLGNANVPGAQAAILQGKFILLANGEMKQVDDNYELKEGEKEVKINENRFQCKPKVILAKFASTLVYDDKGDISEKEKKKPPTYGNLSKTRVKQGAKLREMIDNMDEKKLAELNVEMAEFNIQLGEIFSEEYFEKHQKKVQLQVKSQEPILGKDFRAIDLGMDEIMASSPTESFMEGFYENGDTEGEVTKFIENTLLAMSLLRIATPSVIAPIEYDDEIVGQQHPTDGEQEQLEGGLSSHKYSDRDRSQKAIFGFDEFSDKGKPSNAVYGMMLKAGIATLNSMSAPLGAKNVGKFNEDREEKHWEERENLKIQVNLLAKQLGFKVTEEEQEYESNRTRHEYPTSPRRSKKGKKPVLTLVKEEDKELVDVKKEIIMDKIDFPLILEITEKTKSEAIETITSNTTLDKIEIEEIDEIDEIDLNDGKEMIHKKRKLIKKDPKGVVDENEDTEDKYEISSTEVKEIDTKKQRHKGQYTGSEKEVNN